MLWIIDNLQSLSKLSNSVISMAWLVGGRTKGEVFKLPSFSVVWLVLLHTTMKLLSGPPASSENNSACFIPRVVFVNQGYSGDLGREASGKCGLEKTGGTEKDERKPQEVGEQK